MGLPHPKGRPHPAPLGVSGGPGRHKRPARVSPDVARPRRGLPRHFRDVGTANCERVLKLLQHVFSLYIFGVVVQVDEEGEWGVK